MRWRRHQKNQTIPLPRVRKAAVVASQAGWPQTGPPRHQRRGES